MPESAVPAPAWKAQRERSTRFMLRLLLWFARYAGRGVCRLILVPITAYFLLSAGAARRASRQFLGRALGRPARLADVARHLHTFASVVLDRAFFLLNRTAGIAFDVRRAPEEERGTHGGGRGSLLVVAHLGSFEAMRVVGGGRRPMKVVLDRDQNRMITSVLETVNPRVATQIIDAAQGGPGLALAIKQALDEGSHVGLMVDRPSPGEQTVTVDFLGAPARLPAGPWLLAAALQARVVLCFCVYRDARRYEATFELFDERLTLPRAQRDAALQACVQRYADRLAHHARGAPYNWFNFYDFWHDAA